MIVIKIINTMEIFGIHVNHIGWDMILSDLVLSLIISIWLKWIYKGIEDTIEEFK